MDDYRGFFGENMQYMFVEEQKRELASLGW